MTKRILMLLFIFSIYQFSHAQVYLGVSAGGAFTKFKSPNAYHTKYGFLPGFTVDVPVIITISNRIAIQSGISFVNMGCKENPDNQLRVINQSNTDYIIFQNYSGTYSFNYLSVPITVNVSVPIKENRYSVYARLGGYVSYMMNAALTQTGNRYSSQKKEPVHTSQSDINRYDLGLLFALGTTKKIGKGNLFIEGKYMLGCNNINTNKGKYDINNSANSSDIPYFGNQKIFNRGLFVNAGYVFCLGKAK